MSTASEAVVAAPVSECDVFLSYSRADERLVEALAKRLFHDARIKPWLDKWNLIPGNPWQPTIEGALKECRVCAVIIGPEGPGPWQEQEMRAAINNRVSQSGGGFRVIPVLLPGTNLDRVPPFLAAYESVQFQSSTEESEPFRRLIAGIRGKEPGPSEGASEDGGRATWTLVLSGTVNQIHKAQAEAIIEHLRCVAGDLKLTLKRVEVGSVKLVFEGDRAGYEWARFLFDSAQLRQVENFSIERIYPRHPIMTASLTVKADGDHTAPVWPSYVGSSLLVGASPSGRVTVYVDPALGAPALQNARDLINDADRVVSANDAIFGTPGGPVDVIIFPLNGATDGTGGADHAGCDYNVGSAIEVCASFGNSARVSALFEAELSECSMGGNLCGVSTGEALSRWCAAVIGGNALSDFATAPTWAQDGMPDYISQTDPTDQNADSTGCGMAFLSWLMSRGYGLDRIAPAMVALQSSGTLADLYTSLTGDQATNAWPAFQQAVANLPQGITDDDPFAGAAQPAQLAHLAPWKTTLAAQVFAEVIGDIATGKRDHQIVASVRAVLGATPATKAAGAGHMT